MIKVLIDIIRKVKEKITDSSNLDWTSYNSPEELRNELDTYISQLENGKTECVEKIYILFLPTAPLQEHSISNAWTEEYMHLAEKVDLIYKTMKSQS